MRQSRLLRVLKVVLIAIVALLILGFAVKMLWNWLMPELFGWRSISFPQSLGLLLLCKILFSGFHRPFGHRDHWRGRMRERWEAMTPEEREKFRAGMRGPGCFRRPGETQQAETIRQ